ncbi:hypothetical protein SEA_LOZINAK_141 [Gordonia phage Lozinak]|uniref:Uncharacterized protein n=3 Tax=Smoothievirus TaxID=1982557 RepID=A0A2D1GG71_9CAUD|nr:ATPase [Gordonia phage ClubL]YP_009276254.1 ATPase [Gordonia phage Bachita]YP_009281295.1 ATPase [Gordonia phage Cucurbita]ATN90767.1 hypothetical protein SEA_LOZINAK_141 [Gordonia phage Lozinak]AUE23647.1 membrane protein [Gordonia phage Toniann]ANA86638.1 hypothetical protein PBI_CLUBL_140 [Gordonia phage ClubL]ANA86818.1 hypothetical protein PBI_BACHITA_143 [Gordonia phage Bachita]AOE44228.1 hypothetical protein SEA_CUCURBITA_141 [Gordonia phage Cucurbita]
MILKAKMPAWMYWAVVGLNVFFAVVNAGILIAMPEDATGANVAGLLFGTLVAGFYVFAFVPKRGWWWP